VQFGRTPRQQAVVVRPDAITITARRGVTHEYVQAGRHPGEPLRELLNSPPGTPSDRPFASTACRTRAGHTRPPPGLASTSTGAPERAPDAERRNRDFRRLPRRDAPAVLAARLDTGRPATQPALSAEGPSAGRRRRRSTTRRTEVHQEGGHASPTQPESARRAPSDRTPAVEPAPLQSVVCSAATQLRLRSAPGRDSYVDCIRTAAWAADTRAIGTR
jgi:hypothetical protein